MTCMCGARAYSHCPYCRTPGEVSPLQYGPFLFASDSVIILAGVSGSGKTTLGCQMLKHFGGVVVGNEMSSYAPWGLTVARTIPKSGNVLIDSLESVKLPGMLRRRIGLTIGIARLNAAGGLFGGISDLYDSDLLLALEPGNGVQLFKTRYQKNGEYFGYSIDYPNIHIDSTPVDNTIPSAD